jgi:predicted ATP-dependent endonuclease of OLD family
MRDFLDRELHKDPHKHEVRAYILDPTQCRDPENGVAKPQPLPADSEPMDREPFDGLFKIDVISAQRGFSDPKTEDDSHSGFASLSTQLRQYFSKHLDPSESPDASDIEALQAIEAAKTVFDEKLKTSFAPAIGELEGLNYPGFSDPQISLTSKINPIDSLDHKTAVQFNVLPEDTDSMYLSLPEKYNGLGYQNLISMVFSLIRFRDEWMRVGKAAKRQSNNETIIEPLHIVLIEEPEAHLHAQVQQVFIKKAYQVLRTNDRLKNGQLNTQLIVSTHSSHIAHELNFTCLRYFRREPARCSGEIPSATVVNLSKTFGDDNETSKFATRYIKSTHCDLFFADAAILVEGSAERMLVPHFIRHKFPKLDQSYISLLEIGGSHAHRLRPLLETLGLLSLVITDLDSIGESDTAKVFPERGKNYRTGNTTLKEWIPGEKEPDKPKSLDELLDCSDDDKQSDNKQIRVAYQCPIKLKYKESSTEEESIPYTFEDSLALSNIGLFKGYEKPNGLLKKLKEALGKNTLSEASKEMFDSLGAGSKAGMALELLYLTEPSKLEPPDYISDGLKWLEGKLAEKKQDFLATATEEVKND